MNDAVEGMDADLRRLEGEARKVDATIEPEVLDAATEQEQAAQGPAVNEVAELAGVLQLASMGFIPFFPSLGSVYTADACEGFAGAAIPVMQKHGWRVSGTIGKYAAEIALGLAAFQLGAATYAAVSHDMEAAAAKKKREGKDAPAAGPAAATGQEIPTEGPKGTVAERG